MVDRLADITTTLFYITSDLILTQALIQRAIGSGKLNCWVGCAGASASHPQRCLINKFVPKLKMAASAKRPPIVLPTLA
jgi:hypothetical protein